MQTQITNYRLILQKPVIQSLQILSGLAFDENPRFVNHWATAFLNTNKTWKSPRPTLTPTIRQWLFCR